MYSNLKTFLSLLNLTCAVSSGTKEDANRSWTISHVHYFRGLCVFHSWPFHCLSLDSCSSCLNLSMRRKWISSVLTKVQTPLVSSKTSGLLSQSFRFGSRTASARTILSMRLRESGMAQKHTSTLKCKRSRKKENVRKVARLEPIPTGMSKKPSITSRRREEHA